MPLAEELLLIAFDPQAGKVPMTSPEGLKAGVSAALLAELALAGRLEVRGDRVVVAPGEERARTPSVPR